MNACTDAQHWARRCLEGGLQPRIMAAQCVTAVRKGSRTKDDRADHAAPLPRQACVNDPVPSSQYELGPAAVIEKPSA